jgi:hypothetical protein
VYVAAVKTTRSELKKKPTTEPAATQPTTQPTSQPVKETDFGPFVPARWLPGAGYQNQAGGATGKKSTSLDEVSEPESDVGESDQVRPRRGGGAPGGAPLTGSVPAEIIYQSYVDQPTGGQTFTITGAYTNRIRLNGITYGPTISGVVTNDLYLRLTLTIADSNGGGLGASQTLAFAADTDGAAGVVAVPAPAGLGLLGVALAGLGLVRRRRG